jgi:hypothetical protein
MIRWGRLVQWIHSSAAAKSLKTRVQGVSNYHSNEIAVKEARREARGPS